MGCCLSTSWAKRRDNGVAEPAEYSVEWLTRPPSPNYYCSAPVNSPASALDPSEGGVPATQAEVRPGSPPSPRLTEVLVTPPRASHQPHPYVPYERYDRERERHIRNPIERERSHFHAVRDEPPLAQISSLDRDTLSTLSSTCETTPGSALDPGMRIWQDNRRADGHPPTHTQSIPRHTIPGPIYVGA